MNDSIKKIKLLATYSRVSTSRQEEDGTIETQLLVLREYAKKNGYTIVKEYIDDGWSGDVLARPSLDELRQDAKRKVWEGVLVYDPDRLARRYSYQELITDELREAGVEVIFTTVSTPKNSEDKILHGVRGLFAEYERAKITERFRLGKLRKVREGHILVSEALYGYTYILKKDSVHGYYVINPEEARVVKMVFMWIADHGMTLRGVVKKLQSMGIKPRKSKRGVWNTSTLSTMLRNRAYIGEARWGSSYAVVPENPTNKDKYRKMKKSSRKNKPEEEWVASKIPVPPIVEREQFERARAQLTSNFALCQRNKKNEYLLAGKIRCICGRTRCGEGPMRGKHLYYRCSDRVMCFPLPPTCKEKGLNARIVDRLVWEKVSAFMSSPELMAKQITRWLNKRETNMQSSLGDKESMGREIEKLKDQEERYNKAYGAGLFTIEKLKEYTVPVREKISALEVQMQQIEQTRFQITRSGPPSKNEMRVFARHAARKLQSLNFAAKRVIVLNTVEKVVGTQQQLQVYGYIPVTNYVELFTSDRNCGSAKRRKIDAVYRAYQKKCLDRELSVRDN